MAIKIFMIILTRVNFPFSLVSKNKAEIDLRTIITAMEIENSDMFFM